MSRVGRMPITIPAGVTVNVAEGNVVTVKGPKGELTRTFPAQIAISVEGNTITCTRPNDTKENRAQHGTTRANLNNMVVGVSSGFAKTLIVDGIGYRADKKGDTVTLKLGFSHPVEIKEVPGITMEIGAVEKSNVPTITVKGCDKQVVGQFAAVVRSKRPPEPYKGKGIRYSDEVIRRKEGKTGAKKK
ncbi:MAG: 50S ribosomal protein L6 [Oscillospiraceae bacterium]|nr:50S ribosomal protein L6 [Oscillospiraceae bacterium]